MFKNISVKKADFKCLQMLNINLDKKKFDNNLSIKLKLSKFYLVLKNTLSKLFENLSKTCQVFF